MQQLVEKIQPTHCSATLTDPTEDTDAHLDQLAADGLSYDDSVDDDWDSQAYNVQLFFTTYNATALVLAMNT